MSYRQVAEQVGNPKAVRAVGSANSRNPISIIVPCHRVVGSDGKLIGYAGGFSAKRWLLDHELRTAGLSSPGRSVTPADDDRPAGGEGGVGVLLVTTACRSRRGRARCGPGRSWRHAHGRDR